MKIKHTHQTNPIDIRESLHHKTTYPQLPQSLNHGKNISNDGAIAGGPAAQGRINFWITLSFEMS